MRRNDLWRRAIVALLPGVLACGTPPPPKATLPHAPVVSTLLQNVVSRFPNPTQPACRDAQLRLRFAREVRVGTQGRISVFKASQPSTPVVSIDLAANDFSDLIGGRPFHIVRPVFVDGAEVVVYLPSQALVAGETYFVTVDENVFVDAQRASLGSIVGPTDFRFTTRVAQPASLAALTVAADGSGDFCSVQGGVDALASSNVAPATLLLKNGVYREIVLISDKQRLTLRGEDRKKTIIRYPNNDVLQQKLGAKFRALVSVEDSHDFVLENLTLENSTPQGGSQAEALRVEGVERAILRNADFVSRQDTLLLSGSVYVANTYVEGNVDFIWGKGTAFFDRCEIRTVARSGYLVQSRNGPNRFGYVFVDCKLTAEEGLIGILLARIDANEYPASSVTYINCQMGPQIAKQGWLVTPSGTTETKSLRFWEYQSTDLHGEPLDVTQRHPASRQLTEREAKALRDPTSVFGGWNPLLRSQAKTR